MFIVKRTQGGKHIINILCVLKVVRLRYLHYQMYMLLENDVQLDHRS